MILLLKAGAKEDNWLKRQLIYKQIELNEKYHNQGGQAVKDFANILLHSLPQMFFILLPTLCADFKTALHPQKRIIIMSITVFSAFTFTFSVSSTMLTLFGLRGA